MRESIGGAWITGLVITFMMLFVAYLTVMINYSTTFKNKNEVVSIIEKYEGLSSGNEKSIWIINKYLKNSGYKSTGNCDSDWYGATDLDSSARLAKGAKDAYYCVKYTEVESASKTGYYDVRLFIQFDLPVMGQIAKIKVKGQTIKIRYAQTEGLS